MARVLLLMRKEMRELRNELLLLLGLLLSSYLVALYSRQYTLEMAFLVHVCIVFPVSALMFGVMGWAHERERGTVLFLEALPVRPGFIHRSKLLTYGLVLLGLGLPCFVDIAVVFNHPPLFIFLLSMFVIFPVGVVCGRWLNSVLSGILFALICLIMYLGWLWFMIFVTEPYFVLALHSTPAITPSFDDIMLFIVLLSILVPLSAMFHLKLKSVLCVFLIIVPLMFFAGVRVFQFSQLWYVDFSPDVDVAHNWIKALTGPRDSTRPGFHGTNGQLYLVLSSGLVEIDREGLKATHYKLPIMGDAFFSADGSKLAFKALPPFQNWLMDKVNSWGIELYPIEWDQDNYLYVWDLIRRKLQRVDYIDHFFNAGVLLWNQSSSKLLYSSSSQLDPWQPSSWSWILKQADLETGSVTDLDHFSDRLERGNSRFFYSYRNLEDGDRTYKLKMQLLDPEKGHMHTVYEHVFTRLNSDLSNFRFDIPYLLPPSFVELPEGGVIAYHNILRAESGETRAQLGPGEFYLAALGGCASTPSHDRLIKNHYPVVFIVGHRSKDRVIELRLHHDLDQPADWNTQGEIVYVGLSPDRQFLFWYELGPDCTRRRREAWPYFNSFEAFDGTFFVRISEYYSHLAEVHLLNTITFEDTLIEGVFFSSFYRNPGILLRWSPSGRKCALLNSYFPFDGVRPELIIFEEGECKPKLIEVWGYYVGAFDWLNENMLVYTTWDGEDTTVAQVELNSGETYFTAIQESEGS